MRNIESHLDKSKGITIKKTALTRATQAGGHSNNVVEFLRRAHETGSLKQDQDDAHHMKMVEAATKARQQLKAMKLKTSPIIVGEAPEEKEGAGEEGDEDVEA